MTDRISEVNSGRYPDLPLDDDLFGRVLLDRLHGMPAEFSLRRDDGVQEQAGSAPYFQQYAEIPTHQRELLGLAAGRVLDIGAGAGQHTLALQERQVDVVAIDKSPLAVEVCRRRGVRDVRLMNALETTFADGDFDTALLFGNNIGIAGNPNILRELLAELHRVTRPGGRVLAECADYLFTARFRDFSYIFRNAAQGRYPGTCRQRIEYQQRCSPWFEWLKPRSADVCRICSETGWAVARIMRVYHGSTNAFILEKV
ncbi:MAG: class I SAM-dependent methyltransferase [Armatimonadota bacterium]